MSDTAKKQDTQIGQLGSGEDIERVALAAAEAIERLIAERRTFRSRAGAQERELMRLRATNDELNRQITLIRDCYVRLATECVTQLQHIDEVIRTLVPAPRGHANLNLATHLTQQQGARDYPK
jgi:hypothetical protein